MVPSTSSGTILGEYLLLSRGLVVLLSLNEKGDFPAAFFVDNYIFTSLWDVVPCFVVM